jgi:hypothetical protein
MKVDYLADMPKAIQLADDDYIRVRYDAPNFRWIPSRPSRIKYPTAKEVIRQYRREHKEKWG